MTRCRSRNEDGVRCSLSGKRAKHQRQQKYHVGKNSAGVSVRWPLTESEKPTEIGKKRRRKGGRL